MSRRRIGPIGRALRLLLLTGAAFLLLSIAAVLSLRFVDPWTTAFIVDARVASWFDRDPQPLRLQYQWRDYEAISRQLALAVVASEDQRFPQHGGFDYKQIRKAMDDSQRGRRSRGASTISQQVAKNLFLWSGRSWLRKGLEAWFTVLIETTWSKRRILEVYLNIAEFGRGIYGAEAASQAFFHQPASRLTREQAALLAAVLPNPVRLRADRPGNYVRRRQGEIARQMGALGGTAYLAEMQR